MGRIMAIDYGKKRCGIAVTDILQITPGALQTVATHELEQFLENYLKEESVERILVGHPRQMNNQPSEQMPHIAALTKRLAKRYPQIAVQGVDERFTSVLAQKAIIDGGIKKMQRQNKALVDKVSAVIMLQSYLFEKSAQENSTL